MHRVSIGVDSVVPVRKQTRHHVARVAREGILLWILAKLLVHALCLAWSRFGRSRQEAHTWVLRPLGCFDRHYAKIFGLISCRRTLSGPWHTGLISCSRTLSGPWHTGLGSGLS